MIGALITGAASLLGGERRNSAQMQQAKMANEFSAQQAALNRDFQREMSNTMVQRRMEDMRAGGINPILAANSAASSPAGSAPAGQQAQIMDTITPAVSSAVQANQSMAQAKLIQEQLKPVSDQIGSTAAESYLKLAQRALARMQAEQIPTAIGLLEQQIKKAAKDAVISEFQAEILTKGIEEIKRAFENLDFSAFKEAMQW
jgi:hypothetical protein